MAERQSTGTPQITSATISGTSVEEVRASAQVAIDSLRQSTQYWLQQVFNHLDAQMGFRGTPTFHAAVDVQGNTVNNVGQATDPNQVVIKQQLDDSVAAVQGTVQGEPILVALRSDLFPSARVLMGSDTVEVTDNGPGDTMTLHIPTSILQASTYTPGLTNVANLSASTSYPAMYLRTGDAGEVVLVAGRVDVDPTAATAATQLGLTLPIVSNLANDYDLAGVAFCPVVAGQGAAIYGDIANNRAQMEWLSGDIANRAMYYIFMYRVL